MENLVMCFRVVATIMIAIFVGKQFAKIKLPAILGWLVTGIVVGPYAFNLMSNEILNSKAYFIFSKILESSVGIIFAKDLVYKKIKKYGSQILTITIFESMGTFIVVSGVFALVLKLMGAPLYLALVFGGIALATAPAPSLSIVNEFKTQGPVTNTLIPMAILDDVVAIIVFFSINSYVAAKGAGEGASIFSVLLVSIVIPTIIGIGLGLIGAKIYNKIMSDKGLLITTIILVVGTFILCHSYDIFIIKKEVTNYMLVGMAVFTTIANLVDEEKMERIVGKAHNIVWIGFILMILNLAVPLDYHLIVGAGLLTTVYIVSRGVGKYSSTYIGGKVSKAPETVTKYLGLAMLPHSGVSLVFTGMAVTSLQTVDTSAAVMVQGTIAAAAIINEIFAVVMAKKGFEWAGEIPDLERKKTKEKVVGSISK